MQNLNKVYYLKIYFQNSELVLTNLQFTRIYKVINYKVNQ